MRSDATHLVLGGSGFLGRSLLEKLGRRGVGTFFSTPLAAGVHFDAAEHSFESLLPDFPSLRYAFLLHGAVQPDRCVLEPERSYFLNVTKNQEIIGSLWKRDIVPVFVSSDYVLDGTGHQVDESAPRCPVTAYGRHKAEMEGWLETQAMPYLVCRLSKIVSGDRDTHSVIGQWILDIESGRTMRCARDQIFSPAHVDDIAEAMVALADGGFNGLFNVAGPKPMSRYELALAFVQKLEVHVPGISPLLEEISLRDLKFIEPRPFDTSLSIAKLNSSVSVEMRSMEAICEDVARDYSLATRYPR